MVKLLLFGKDRGCILNSELNQIKVAGGSSSLRQRRPAEPLSVLGPVLGHFRTTEQVLWREGHGATLTSLFYSIDGSTFHLNLSLESSRKYNLLINNPTPYCPEEL